MLSFVFIFFGFKVFGLVFNLRFNGWRDAGG